MATDVSESEQRAVIRMRTREARVRRGLTQAEIAALLNVGESTYAKWESREISTIPTDKIARFCLAVGIKPEDLVRIPTREEVARARATKTGRPKRRVA